MNKKNIMIVAGEISGDLYGAALIRVLKGIHKDIDFICIGSKKMEKEVGKLFCDSTSWGVIGLVEAIKKLPNLYLVYKRIKHLFDNSRIDLLILIDYPGFNMRLVHAAKKRGIKTIYYIPPSKWAKTPNQIHDAAVSIDKILTTLESTYQLYLQAGANVEYVGHPLLDIVSTSDSTKNLKKRYNIKEGEYILSLLPGSREKELVYMLPVIFKTAQIIQKKIKNIQFLIPITSATLKVSKKYNEKYIRRYLKENLPSAKLIIDETYDALAISNFAIITSGTATLEAACLNIPMIIIYRVSKITEWIARLSSKLPVMFGLPNLLMGRQLIPELAQSDASPQNIANEFLSYYYNPEKLKEQIKFLKQIRKKMGEKGATNRTADIILNELK